MTGKGDRPKKGTGSFSRRRAPGSPSKASREKQPVAFFWRSLFLALCSCVHTVPLPAAAELHRAMTSDGVEISMVRYPGKGRPVLLCHGISANDRNMDLDDEHSLARWLSAHGREAWTMSLRGTGGSGSAPGTTFDDFWRKDLPAAIDEVRRTSGSQAVDYIGHSMGGMILYAYLAEGGQGVHAAVTLGSPTTFAFGLRAQALLRGIGGIPVPSGVAASVAAPFSGALDDNPVQLLLYNPQNTDAQTWSRLMAYGTANIAAGVVRQLSGLARGEFKSADGERDFRKDMGTIRTPVMVVAARLDRTAPAPAVKDGYRCLGGPKKWLLVSQANGAKAEYGHMDLVIGSRAKTEVWPSVLAFLNE
jgi:polyhydroxyalkanoate synthase